MTYQTNYFVPIGNFHPSNSMHMNVFYIYLSLISLSCYLFVFQMYSLDYLKQSMFCFSIKLNVIAFTFHFIIRTNDLNSLAANVAPESTSIQVREGLKIIYTVLNPLA